MRLGLYLFILFDKQILQHVAFKVISLGLNALFQSPLPRFHALLEGFLRDRLKLSRHAVLMASES